MCALCTAIEAGKLSREEAKKALLELIVTDSIDIDHRFKVVNVMDDKFGAEPKSASTPKDGDDEVPSYWPDYF